MVIHESHNNVSVFLSGEFKCMRCNMCSCHTPHKLIEECDRVDGRAKKEEDI